MSGIDVPTSATLLGEILFMCRHACFTLILAALAAPALAQAAPAFPQSLQVPAPRRAETASGAALPPLPSTGLAEDATAETFLRNAVASVVHNRLGTAREAMEMAQTRLLDRSVPLGQTRDPSDNQAVRQISLALKALSEGDRATTVQHIQDAIQSLGGPSR